jgi:hypothetical protein
MVRSAVFFAAMSVAYYAWAAEVLDVGWNVHLRTAWLFLSVTAVPATALAVWWATQRADVLPGALLGGAVIRQVEIWTGAQPYLVRRPVQAAVDIVVALVLVLGLPRHGRTRLWALVLTVPLTWGRWLSGLLDQVP